MKSCWNFNINDIKHRLDKKENISMLSGLLTDEHWASLYGHNVLKSNRSFVL